MPEGDDKTTLATIDANKTSKAFMRARKDGVVAGTCVAALVFERVGVTSIKYEKECGQELKAGENILVIEGKSRDILRSERIALNFISHLSGISLSQKSGSMPSKAREQRFAIPEKQRQACANSRNSQYGWVGE
jgi:nicotinate-nucleotide pyrophosphorylase (carboxylating)